MKDRDAVGSREEEAKEEEWMRVSRRQQIKTNDNIKRIKEMKRKALMKETRNSRTMCLECYYRSRKIRKISEGRLKESKSQVRERKWRNEERECLKKRLNSRNTFMGSVIESRTTAVGTSAAKSWRLVTERRNCDDQSLRLALEARHLSASPSFTMRSSEIRPNESSVVVGYK
jgi:DNA-directed RNA polymerase subunit H (RpoH/RPB5)